MFFDKFEKLSTWAVVHHNDKKLFSLYEFICFDDKRVFQLGRDAVLVSDQFNIRPFLENEFARTKITTS